MLSDIILPYCLSVMALASVPGVAVTNLTFSCYNYGRQVAINMACGVALARMSIICLLLAGFQAVVYLLEAASDVLKIGAALYLVWFGYCLFRRTGVAAIAVSALPGFYRQILSGFLITWCNPKALLFSVVILPQFIDPKMVDVFQIFLLGSIWVFISLVVELIYISLTSWICARPSLRSNSLRTLPAIALVCYGLWLVFGEVFELTLESFLS